MCSSKSKFIQPTQNTTPAATMVSDINGRPVLQPATSNRSLLTRHSLKKSPSLPSKSPSTLPLNATNQPDSMNSSSERLFPTTPTNRTAQKPIIIPVKKYLKKVTSNNNGGGAHDRRSGEFTISSTSNPNSLVKYSSAAIVDAPGRIADERRVQVAAIQVQRKMRIAHYGRFKSANKYDSCSKLMTSYFDPNSLINATTTATSGFKEEKRCSFITPTSDPIYVGYHDEEWGVPVHDDKLLFELLVLTGAQVGSEWTSVLRKRQKFREAFSEFEAEIVSKFTDKKITSISSCYGIEVGLIRGVVDNSNCILQIKKAFGSFDKYLWGFVNHKPIVTQYKPNQKIPVKTSKSEAISKDMVRRGFRQVGPTVIHSFMQASGLTNDHLITCPRHLQCRRHSPIIN